MFAPLRHYRCERVVALSASIDTSGRPNEIKLRMVDRLDLEPNTKEPTPIGRRRIMAQAAASRADAQWLSEWKPFPAPLRDCFKEARQWLVNTFNGVGTKHLQRCLDENVFRWNAAARSTPFRQEWYKLCFRPCI